MKADKICKDAIKKAVFAVREAEKSALDTDYSGKLDLIRDLTEVEKRLMTIADCVAVEPLKIDEDTDLKDLYDDGLITIRTYNVCKRAGIDTLKEVCELTEDKFLRIRNLGKCGADEMKKIMKQHGMKFATEET